MFNLKAQQVEVSKLEVLRGHDLGAEVRLKLKWELNEVNSGAFCERDDHFADAVRSLRESQLTSDNDKDVLQINIKRDSEPFTLYLDRHEENREGPAKELEITNAHYVLQPALKLVHGEPVLSMTAEIASLPYSMLADLAEMVKDAEVMGSLKWTPSQTDIFEEADQEAAAQ